MPVFGLSFWSDTSSTIFLTMLCIISTRLSIKAAGFIPYRSIITVIIFLEKTPALESAHPSGILFFEQDSETRKFSDILLSYSYFHHEILRSNKNKEISSYEGQLFMRNSKATGVFLLESSVNV